MIGILIVTHGSLGDALIGAATHVLGKPLEGLHALPVDGNEDPDTLLARARRLAGEIDMGQGVLLLSDICGGTPCNIVTRLVAPGNIEAVSGVSLPMLVRALTYRDRPLAEVVDKALSGGTEGVLRLSGEAAHAPGRS
ncbi:MAG: PTS sugar transporter subunit IIA [Betaproteobacteria bacterium]|nr:PTS sugar transporter subunit IIA [Betaproteobacteria bacterium]